MIDMPRSDHGGEAIPRWMWHFGFWERADYAYYISSTKDNKNNNQQNALSSNFVKFISKIFVNMDIEWATENTEIWEIMFIPGNRKVRDGT